MKKLNATRHTRKKSKTIKTSKHIYMPSKSRCFHCEIVIILYATTACKNQFFFSFFPFLGIFFSHSLLTLFSTFICLCAFFYRLKHTTNIVYVKRNDAHAHHCTALNKSTIIIMMITIVIGINSCRTIHTQYRVHLSQIPIQ